MSVFQVYMIGVGGQGIGLLSEVLIRAADAAGLPAVGCDTHGLAQRGGIVASHLRLGASANSPLIRPGTADLVAALERHEALRAMNAMLRDGGAMAWYDAVWQPLDVRMGKAPILSHEAVEEEARRRGISCRRVRLAGLEDPRMQNTALLAQIARRGLIPGIHVRHYEEALADLLTGPVLERNLALFRPAAEGGFADSTDGRPMV